MLSLLIYAAVFLVSGLSVYYSVRLYLLVPAERKDAVRHLMASVVSLAVATSLTALTLISWEYHLSSSSWMEALARVALLASMSFFLLMSFQVKKGSL